MSVPIGAAVRPWRAWCWWSVFVVINIGGMIVLYRGGN